MELGRAVAVGVLPGRAARSLLSVESELSAAAQWDALAERLEHPFLRREWLNAWWEAFAPAGAERTPAEIWGEGRLLGAAPIYSVADGRRVHGMANVHTPISGVLAAFDRLSHDDVVDLLPAAARSLEWPALDERTADGMAAALADGGWLVRVEGQHRSPVVEMQGSAASYARSRGRSLRQRAGRLERKLAREHLAGFVFTPAGEDPQLLESCLRLEALGWKGKRGTAILSNPRVASFYRAVGRMPEAYLAALVGPDGPVAFALCLLHGRRLFLLKTAYDERLATLSPGFALHYRLVTLCHELDFEACELLGAADRWKLQLATSDRPISRLVAHAPSLLGHAHIQLRRARPLAKTLRARVVASKGR